MIFYTIKPIAEKQKEVADSTTEPDKTLDARVPRWSAPGTRANNYALRREPPEKQRLKPRREAAPARLSSAQHRVSSNMSSVWVPCQLS